MQRRVQRTRWLTVEKVLNVGESGNARHRSLARAADCGCGGGKSQDVDEVIALQQYPARNTSPAPVVSTASTANAGT
jgi:hypothetical protein